MPQKATLKVFANPFVCELDHEGRAHGRLAYEPNIAQGDAHLRWVGCRVKATLLRKQNTNDSVRELHDHWVEYATEPTLLEESEYYRRAIREGALFAVDVDTHARAFGTRDGFVDPRKRLAQLASERKAIPMLEGPEPAAGAERDRDAEWAAFVAPPAATKFTAARAAAAAPTTAKAEG